jgi:hypothetical protein
LNKIHIHIVIRNFTALSEIISYSFYLTNQNSVKCLFLTICQRLPSQESSLSSLSTLLLTNQVNRYNCKDWDYKLKNSYSELCTSLDHVFQLAQNHGASFSLVHGIASAYLPLLPEPVSSLLTHIFSSAWLNWILYGYRYLNPLHIYVPAILYYIHIIIICCAAVHLMAAATSTVICGLFLLWC